MPDPSANSKSYQSSPKPKPINRTGLKADAKDYWSSRPRANLKEIKENVGQVKAGQQNTVWGTGMDGRVYRWNGANWDEPNSKARLKYVDAATQGAGVWGVGADHRVYTWNGSSWDEPNPGATLYEISAFDEFHAIGLGWEGRLYRTTDGGQKWLEFTEHDQFLEISVGQSSQNFMWGIKKYEVSPNVFTTQIWRFDYSISDFVMVPCGLLASDISATTGADGVWLVDHNNDIYKWDGLNWYQPNPQAGLYTIDCNGSFDTAWGIGYGGRVFRTTNSGQSWDEPNPAAKLFHISSN